MVEVTMSLEIPKGTLAALNRLRDAGAQNRVMGTAIGKGIAHVRRRIKGAMRSAGWPEALVRSVGTRSRTYKGAVYRVVGVRSNFKVYDRVYLGMTPRLLAARNAYNEEHGLETTLFFRGGLTIAERRPRPIAGTYERATEEARAIVLDAFPAAFDKEAARAEKLAAKRGRAPRAQALSRGGG